ncbi:MAG: 5'-deoxynucleotidase [Clostridiales bacterium]|nr:5'-deoxynucleotidase [Clostridiales bacterium]
MNYSFLAMLFRQRYIKRWSLMHSTEPETLSRHTMECAVISHCLCEIGNSVFGKNYDSARAALLSLFHDAAEVVTGDLPTPVKYASDTMRRSYADIEAAAKENLLSKLPDELRPAYEKLLKPDNYPETSLIKAADKLCALIKCIIEKNSGNREFDAAYSSTLEILKGMENEEVEWFMEYLLPAFSKSLDEL